MADPSAAPLSEKIAAALPYALPVLGGVIGVAYVNMTQGNPVLGIGLGVVAGRVIAHFVVKLIR